jgi:hypothetical protein
MTLSRRTLRVLTNFADINQSLLFRAGTLQRTIAPSRSILAEATFDECIPRDFAIYDLRRFLKVYRQMAGPITFSDEYLLIGGEQRHVKYSYTRPDIVIIPPDTTTPCEFDYELDLSRNVLMSVRKVADLLDLPDLTIVGDGRYVRVGVTDTMNQSGDGYGQIVAIAEVRFNAVLKMENVRVLDDNYLLRLSKKGLVQFSSDRMTYYIPCTQASWFD